MAHIQATRMKKEREMLQTDPPPGIACTFHPELLNSLEARVIGAKDTPYERGVFKLDINIPNRYPFEPPSIRFVTPIYHPNIDNEGRICLDILKMPPKGSWRPGLNLSSVLKSIQLLMAEPNPDDPLVIDISYEYKLHRMLYLQHAKEHTQLHAMEQNFLPCASGDSENVFPSMTPNVKRPCDTEESQSKKLKII